MLTNRQPELALTLLLLLLSQGSSFQLFSRSLYAGLQQAAPLLPCVWKWAGPPSMVLPSALRTPVGKDAVLSIWAPCWGPIKQAAHCVRFFLSQALLIGLRTIPLCVLSCVPKVAFAEDERWCWLPGIGTCGELSNGLSMIPFPATQESSCQGSCDSQVVPTAFISLPSSHTATMPSLPGFVAA